MTSKPIMLGAATAALEHSMARGLTNIVPIACDASTEVMSDLFKGDDWGW